MNELHKSDLRNSVKRDLPTESQINARRAAGISDWCYGIMAACEAFRIFDRDREKVKELLTPFEMWQYDMIIEQYPDGYKSYREKSEKEARRILERLQRIEPPDDQIGLFPQRLGGLIEKQGGSMSVTEDIQSRRWSEKKEWNRMSSLEREKQREGMEATGNYWGPEHHGHEYWL